MNLRTQNLMALTLLTFLASGCASSNVNARKTEAVTGCVDFYVVVSKRAIMGGTRTRSGRQTDIQRNESTMYQLSAGTGSSIPFQHEQQMSYVR